MATNQGPASGNGVLTFQVPGGSSGSGAYAITEGIEIQVPSGAPSLEPSRAPFVDPQATFMNVNSAQFVPINSTVVFGVTGATVKFANPA